MSPPGQFRMSLDNDRALGMSISTEPGPSIGVE